MNLWLRTAIAGVIALVAACGQTPIKPAATHMREEARTPGAIPPPVQVAPVLPKPEPVARPETYSVVVNRVPAQELLFALARDARLQIDIDPQLTGLVTLNAVDQTLPQLLARIARQVDMRFEIDGQNLTVMRDTPFLRSYRVDYLSANRNVTMRTAASTQFGTTTTTAGGTTAGAAATGATSTIEVTAQNHLWESVVQNVREILRETDRMVPAAGVAAAAPQASQTPTGASTPSATPAPASAAPGATTLQEAASVIANRESGVLFVRATAKQHERVQEFLD
ncbi:MAG TPA: type II and III secretion system protein, partial [Burkholderiales bacterium]|nr:type II and III secretion system protein [Burkholderiales bacterium]